MESIYSYRQDGFHCPRQYVVKNFGAARDYSIAAPTQWVRRLARTRYQLGRS
ncbi:MAG: hypothetical protein WAO76_10960 [Georgfuchsia sp.]